MNTTDPDTPAAEDTDKPAAYQSSDDARRPNDRLNKDQPSTEGSGAPIRKSSLL